MDFYQNILGEKKLDSKGFNCQAVNLKVLLKKNRFKECDSCKGLTNHIGAHSFYDEEMKPRGRKGLAQPSGELLNWAHSNAPTGVCLLEMPKAVS